VERAVKMYKLGRDLAQKAAYKLNFVAIVLTIASSRFMPPPLIKNIYFSRRAPQKSAFRGLNDETDLPTQPIEAQASSRFPRA